MIHLGKLIVFVVLLTLGSRVVRAREPGPRRRAINLLLAYLVLASLLVGVVRRDAWPFSVYRMYAAAVRLDAPTRELVFVGVSEDGREWPIDPRTWSPVSSIHLKGWLARVFPALPEEEKGAVARFLLGKAEIARAHLHAGRRIGSARWLGVLAVSPDWGVPRSAGAVSAAPYGALRIYEVSWVPRERVGHPDRARRTLIVESRWR